KSGPGIGASSNPLQSIPQPPGQTRKGIQPNNPPGAAPGVRRTGTPPGGTNILSRSQVDRDLENLANGNDVARVTALRAFCVRNGVTDRSVLLTTTAFQLRLSGLYPETPGTLGLEESDVPKLTALLKNGNVDVRAFAA